MSWVMHWGLPETHASSVAAVNLSRVSLAAVSCAAAVVALAGCGSDSDTSAAGTSSSPVSDVWTPPSLPSTAPADSPCPTAAPTDTAAPEWQLNGTTGSISVTGSTDKAAPRVDVKAPFSVTETQVHTLTAGDGPVVSPTASVLVCYMGVNGRDGSVFDSSYQTGSPVDFTLDRVVPGFQKAIAGQKVGSTVGVAMTSADGYPDGQPSAGINPGDSLIFAIKILNAQN
jgi:hypothetical protein